MDDWLDLNPNPCGDKNLVTKKKKKKKTTESKLSRCDKKNVVI
jgi:hypothetical protein